MNARGHNERSFRLDTLASEAREGLKRVEQGEENSIGGWLAYGLALNEGRALFPANREFGEWVALSQLDTTDRMDRAAAMWAAANADQFEEARQRGNPRTIRGIHAKWKEIEAEREAERFAEEKRQREQQAKDAAQVEEIPSERTNREDGAIGREGYAPDGSSRLSAGRTADPSDTGVTVEEGHKPAAGGSPAPDPYGYSKLTEEALLDLANGLRADLDEEKAKRKAAETEVKSLKAKLRDFQDDDKDAVIRRLQASVNNAENAKWKALEDRDAFHRQLFAVKKERDAALKSLSGQEFTL